MKIFHRISLFLITVISLNSCTKMYIPPIEAPTDFTKSNDIAMGGNLIPYGVGASLAYSPIRYFFIFGDGVIAKNGGHGEKLQAYSYGLGGYYLFHEFHRFEVKLGYGEGNFQYVDMVNGSNDNLTSAKGNYNHYFGSIKYIYQNTRKSKHGVFFSLGNLNNHYSYVNIPVNHDLKINPINIGYILQFEIVPHLNLNLNLGATLPYQNWKINDFNYRTDHLIMSIGLQFNLRNKTE